MRYLKIILPLMVLFLILLLVRQNVEVFNHEVQFRLNLLLFTLQSAPHRLWVILLYTLFLGIVGTGLYSLVEVVRLKQANRQLRHDLELLKSEMQTLHPEPSQPAASQAPGASAPEAQ
jgi:putative membrane protein